MFNFLLDAVASIKQVPHETFAEKLAVGTEVTVRGMLTVFAVLILIWMLVELLHVLLGDKSQAPAKKAENAPAPTPTKAEPLKETTDTQTSTAPDYELIAVITAAVAAASGSSPNSFRVVSFKRANNKFSSGK